MFLASNGQRSVDSRPKHFGNEEFVNFLTHGGGFLLALVGAAVLFASVAGISSHAMRLSCWIYGAVLVALYAASTLSHLFESPGRRHFFRSLDQGFIFLFIAANFTPLSIALLPTITGWLLLGVMWTIAVVGFSAKVFWKHRVDSIALTHYLVLAWLPITVIVPILRSIPADGAFWFIAGGIAYTAGTFFLALDQRVRYFHALWHLCVIAGSACHFLVIIDYTIPLIG